MLHLYNSSTFHVCMTLNGDICTFNPPNSVLLFLEIVNSRLPFYIVVSQLTPCIMPEVIYNDNSVRFT